MNKAEAMRAYLDELDKRVKLDGQLRKLKAELRLTQKALKGQAVNESRIVGQVKQEKRDMWGAMYEACHNYSPLSKACYGHVEHISPCSMASCPLLNPKVKE